MANIYGLQDKKRYPLNSSEQVKVASSYFEKNYVKLNPSDRAEFAHAIVKQASAFNVDITDPNVVNYSKHGQYSPGFEHQIHIRKIACGQQKLTIDDKKVSAEKVLEKLASSKEATSPIEMVQGLSEFDKLAGLELHYDIDGFRDPYFSVFGSADNPYFDTEKIASDLDINSLKKFIKKPGAKDELMTIFGENFADGFVADPIKSYNGIGNVEKQIVNDVVRKFKSGAVNA